MVSGNSSIRTTAVKLVNGTLPSNLFEISMKSTNYRDGIINTLINEVDNTTQQQTVLELLSACVASIPDEETDQLRVFTEYTASLALVWGETKIASKAILRNNPKTASSFLKTIASALDKNMNRSMFQNLLTNSTSNAVEMWETVERPVLFPAS
jgi:hypothetical protein